MGGTLLKHKGPIHIIYLGGGRDLKQRLGAKFVSRKLKATTSFFEKSTDNSYDLIPILDFIQYIESVMRVFKPDIVYTHSGSDLNVDHQIAFKATITACRPQSGVKEILSFEVPSSTELGTGFKPTVFKPIDSLHKWELLQFYGSELRARPHPRSCAYINSLATIRGGQSGLMEAEAFELVRRVDA